MWYVLVMFPSEGNKVRHIDMDGYGSSEYKDGLIIFASMLNKREGYDGRYFVVHEDELSMFGLQL